MSRIIRRAHLILVAAYGKRLADPPPGGPTPRKRGRMSEAERRELRDRLRSQRNR